MERHQKCFWRKRRSRWDHSDKCAERNSPSAAHQSRRTLGLTVSHMTRYSKCPRGVFKAVFHSLGHPCTPNCDAAEIFGSMFMLLSSLDSSILEAGQPMPSSRKEEEGSSPPGGDGTTFKIKVYKKPQIQILTEATGKKSESQFRQLQDVDPSVFVFYCFILCISWSSDFYLDFQITYWI